jgi:hypothetical protein
MKLLVRVHPELRRRAKTAEQAFAQRRWREEVDQWFDRDRSAQLVENRALQAVDPTPSTTWNSLHTSRTPVALRTIGAPEPGDARRRSGAHR